MRQVMKRAGVNAPVRFRSSRSLERVPKSKTSAVAGESMKRTATRLVGEDAAQDLIEYALLAALLGVACITGILQLTGIRQFFVTVGQALGNAL